MDSCHLHDPTYLVSLVEIIADHQTSTHDLLDAYATFANRIRSQSHFLEASDTLLPALAPIKHHKDSFVRALRRDVCLAHIDPLSRLRSSLDEISSTSSIHFNIEVDTKQYARDASSLCHHALCALATIFRFPAFHFVFPEYDLSMLFNDILDIANAEHLPVLNEAKTYSLSLWALSCHRLPAPVLASRRDDVFSALQRSLDTARQHLLDGLKAISHTIDHHPSGFLNLLSPLLPHVISTLHSESSELRLHASITLGKFANALIHQTELSLAKWQTLSKHTTFFFESCCDESQVAPEDTSFLRIVRAALSTEPHSRTRDAPTWILTVIASLIVLCGPNLYRKPTVLRLILQALAMTLTHKRSIVRALHPHVWRCFVWTFSRMLFSSENVEPAVLSSAFYVIKQEVRGGIGIAFVNALLSDQIPAIRSDERDDRVSQALSVIKAMVRSDCKHTRREGFMFLQALSNGSQARHQILQNVYEVPASVLLNGAIIGVGWDTLPPTIHTIPKVPVSVHWLEEAEIAHHYKTLLVIWKHFATNADKQDLDSGLVDVWLSILLACSHELECGQQITATTEVQKYTAAMIVEFLPSTTFEAGQPDQASHQLCSFTFIDQLWSAMRKAFVAFRLAEVAALILTSILKHAFHTLDPSIRTVWGRLCANLMTTASPSFLCDIHDLTASQLVIRNQRELWGVITTSMSSSELYLDWKELVKFLAIPICTWVLSGPELDAWKAFLRNAITVSGNSTTVTEHLFLQYFQGKEIETWDSIIPVLCFLLAYTHEHGNPLTDEFLSTVDVCLTVSYNRARLSPETLTHSLELLNVIRQVMVSVPGKLTHILQTLGSSLCLWIEDRTEVMSNNEFNSVAVSLYCETLEVLNHLPLSIQALHDMENFLASAFSRIPTPAIAPFAFEKFWRATYHGRSEFYNTLPPKIKSCLACFVAAYGGDLADGLSLTTGSQSQSISNASEAHFPTSHLHQDSGEFSLRVSQFSTSMNVEAWAEVFDVEATPHGDQQMLTGQDTALLIPSADDDARPTVLRQLQEYSSRIDAFSLGGSERVVSNPQILLSPLLHPDAVMPSSHSPEKTLPPTSHVSNQKRKLADGDDVPQKRSRTSRRTLSSVRKLESEPASRDVTPINVPRTNSVPLKKRMVFDGVQVPTLSQVLRQRRADMRQTAFSIRQDLVSVPKTPPRSAQRNRTSPSPVPASVGSDEDDLDWENFRIHATSSEADIDRSLGDICPSSPPRTPTSAHHEPVDELHLPSGLPKLMSQRSSPSAPSRPSLQRAKTTSARLDALQDIYSSVANGASQIPMSELLQATRLVHRIGAVLTEQMGKKMGGPG